MLHNPAGTPDAWDPYPLSLRLVNCLKHAASTEGTWLLQEPGISRTHVAFAEVPVTTPE